jgi:acetoin utilization deacetylase AcuC-like enzyme
VVNVPLPAAGVGTEAFVAVWQTLLPQVAAAVRPALLIVSAGFDYVAGDPVGDLGIGVAAAGDVAATIGETARRFCGGRAAYVLEGGYNLDALTDSIALVASSHDRAVETASLSAVPQEIGDTLRQISLEIRGGSPKASN